MNSENVNNQKYTAPICSLYPPLGRSGAPRTWCVEQKAFDDWTPRTTACTATLSALGNQFHSVVSELDLGLGWP